MVARGAEGCSPARTSRAQEGTSAEIPWRRTEERIQRCATLDPTCRADVNSAESRRDQFANVRPIARTPLAAGTRPRPSSGANRRLGALLSIAPVPTLA